MLVLAQRAFDHAFGATFTQLLATYDDWTEALVWMLEPLVRAFTDRLREWFDWPSELHLYWRHILIVLSLYMTNYIANNVGERPRNALALALVAGPLAVFGAAGFGLIFETEPAVALALPVLALVLFALAASASTAIFYPPKGKNPWVTFCFYWERTVMPVVVFGAVAVAAALAAPHVLPSQDLASFVLILFGAFVLALAMNLLIRGPSRNKAPPKGQGLKHWFSGSFGPRLGTRIASVYALATAQLLLDHYVFRALGW